MRYEIAKVKIQKGDFLISKMGFVNESPIDNKSYLFHKQEYLGDGVWRIIGNKQEVIKDEYSNKE